MHGARAPIPLTTLIYIIIITIIIVVVVVIVVVAVVVVVIVGVGKKAAEEGGVEPQPLVDCEGIRCKEVGGKDHLRGEGEEAGEEEGRYEEKKENRRKLEKARTNEGTGKVWRPDIVSSVSQSTSNITLHGFGTFNTNW